MTDPFAMPENTPTRSRRRGNTNRRWRTLIITVICFALFGAAAGVAYKTVWPIIEQAREPEDFSPEDGRGAGTARIQIESGESGTAVGKKLVEAGVVKTVEGYVKASKANPKSTGIQPGTYELPKKVSSADAITALLSKDSRRDAKLTIIEGRWIEEIFSDIAKFTGQSVEEVKAAAKDPSLKLPAEANGNLEGYLWPSTYTFDPDVKALEVLRTMREQHTKKMAELNIKPEDQHRMIIKASIIQAEAKGLETMSKVSTVIDNRLKKPMRLEMDSTIAYAAQVRRVFNNAEQRKIKHPANTYTQDGLPKVPIGTPGMDALKAATNPTPGPWLYFLAVDLKTGETKFSVTFKEHQKWIVEMRKRNKGFTDRKE